MGAWLIRNKEVFADFTSDDELVIIEEKICSKWYLFVLDEDTILFDSFSFLEPTLFIEFGIIRKIGFRNKAQNLSVIQKSSDIIKGVSFS